MTPLERVSRLEVLRLVFFSNYQKQELMKEVKTKKRSNRKLLIMNPKVAGIDIGASCHYVCVGNLSEDSVRRFGTFTHDLEALADWLLRTTGDFLGKHFILESELGEFYFVQKKYIRNMRLDLLTNSPTIKLSYVFLKNNSK